MKRLDLDVEGGLTDLPRLRGVVQALLRELPPQALDDDARYDFLLAVNEAASNVLRHAYTPEDRPRMRLEGVLHGDGVEVRLWHWGRSFDPHQTAAALESPREGGMGLHIIREYTDAVCYFVTDDGRNCIRLTRQFNGMNGRTTMTTDSGMAKIVSPLAKAKASSACAPARLKTESGRTKMAAVLDRVGDVTVAAVGSEFLDASNSKEFKQEMASVVEGTRKLVLDFGRVSFVDSSGCGAILTCLRQLTAAGGDMKLCGVSKPVRALFQLVRMHRILDIYNTQNEAVAAFGA